MNETKFSQVSFRSARTTSGPPASVGCSCSKFFITPSSQQRNRGTMSIVRRVWQRMFKPAYFVGKDMEGNKYFEHPNANNGRSKRTVKYRENEDMWAYVASDKRLPVQWSAWLTHTRPDPPSVEELQADLARQQRVKLNAAILEAKDEAERANRERLDTPSHHPEIETRSPSVSQNVPGDQRLEPESDQRPKAQTRDPWAEASKGSDEPRSWTPMARKR